jgi:hypothetical protein
VKYEMAIGGGSRGEIEGDRERKRREEGEA